jgi:26S proteasome regulatory subunit N9
MKAMSLGLVKGSIDQVDELVRITWVQPRSLDKDRLRVMKNKLSKWKDNVEQILRVVSENVEDF